MNKKGISAIIIIVISLVALSAGYLVYKTYSDKTGTPLSSGSSINIRMYDADGNLIEPEGYSLVNGQTGVTSFALDVIAENRGSIPLSCEMPGGMTPTIFDTSMPRRTVFIPANGQGEWSSNAMLASQFESMSQPVRFSVKVRCSYPYGGSTNYLEQNTYVDIQIVPEGTGDFTIRIGNIGGLPSEYCGDNVCQTSENTIGTPGYCPSDCVQTSKAKFRTSDLSYVTGSAIAYNDACGSILNQYGYESMSCWTDTTTACPVKTGHTLVTITPPGKPVWSTNNACLYKVNADTTKMVVAWKTTSLTGSPCTTIGQWGTISYDSDSTYKTKVSNSYVSFNTQKEVSCI